MITDGILMLGAILALAGAIIVLERSSGWGVFRYVPGIVFMYLLCATLNSVGLFSHAEEARAPLGAVKDVLLPAMILLFLFGCDLRRIIRLGPKLLLAFAVAAASISGAMVLVYALFQGVLHPESWKVLGALVASWTGGSANMVAVQDILQAPESIFGYALITDTILYSVWLMLMFASVAIAPAVDRFTKADSSSVLASSTTLSAIEDQHEDTRPITAASLTIVLLGSLAASTFAGWLGTHLPEIGTVVNATTWTIILVSALGLIIAVTPLGRTAGSLEIASLMLFVVIGQIASGSDFSALTQAPVYLLIGALVLVIHGAVMLGYAKLTRTDLATLAVASTANVGGVASAPVVASAFHRQLIPVGVLFGLLGSLLGTFIGLTMAQVMSWI